LFSSLSFGTSCDLAQFLSFSAASKSRKDFTPSSLNTSPLSENLYLRLPFTNIPHLTSSQPIFCFKKPSNLS